MANYDSNYAIAQEISARIGTSPIPFDSVYSIALEIYNELGGEPTQFDSVYSILLGILPLVEGGIASKVIDDSVITTVKTWSSNKIASELANAGFDVEIVESLPVSGDVHTIYFVPASESGATDVYDEYMYVDSQWEQVGSTRIDLSEYAKKMDYFIPLDMGTGNPDFSVLSSATTNGIYRLLVGVEMGGQIMYTGAGNLYVISAFGSVMQIIVIPGYPFSIIQRVSEDNGTTWTTDETSYAAIIDDSTTSQSTVETYSKSKINQLVSAKQNSLTAGTNITIDSANTITAKGYEFNGETGGGFAEKYKQDAEDGGQIVNNTATGLGSHAEGYITQATGDYGSHAEGNMTQATGAASHAEGNFTQATGIASHTEGQLTKATDYYAHAEGNKTNATGYGSHAEGFETTAQNMYEHAEGTSNYSHTVSDSPYGNAGNTQLSVGIGGGFNTEADTRKNAFEIMQNADMYIKGVGGYDGIHIKGQDSGITVQTVQEVISGINTSVAGKQDVLTPSTNITIDASNNISADGYFYDETKGSFVTKYRQDAEDGGALVLNIASGLSAVAEGYGTTASGDYGSHAECNMTQATGIASHAEGNHTHATGMVSHAEGTQTTASGTASHAEGAQTNATGSQSHTEGYGTTAQGMDSHAEGYGTTAQNLTEHAEGQYNASHKASDTYGDAGNTQHSVGIGVVGGQVRKNAFEIMQNADMYVLGVGGYQGTDTKVQDATIKTLQAYLASLEARINALEGNTTVE